jgi:heat shock protein HtpX
MEVYMGKRILLFILTNIAVLALVSIILSIFNIDPYISQHGLDYKALLIFSAIFGFVGSFFSLFISKWIAKHAYGVKIIQQSTNQKESILIQTIQQLSQRLGIRTPEIGIYNSPDPNAFATGWSRNNSLVAVSSGLLNDMNEDELVGVLGHEMSHIANGDMVTMALIQGIVNTFVIFFSRIVAYIIAMALSRGEGEGMSTVAFYVTAIVFQIIFGILASTIVMAFSRWREFRADRGSADLTSREKMIAALERLKQYQALPEDNRSPATSALMINRHSKVLKLFSSHPPLEARIKALRY